MTEPRRKELEDIMAELESRKKLRGMDFYTPNRMQWEAHRSTAHCVLVCAGNRTGKSTFGAMELCFHLTRNYPDWYPVEKRFDRPVKCAISATSFAIIARVIEPKLFSLLPKDYYTYKKTPQGYLSKVTCVDGSTVDILTLEMDDKMYESADWDVVWEDEPQHQRKREGIVRGLVDRNGYEIITFTPITEPWMKEALLDKADQKEISVFTSGIRDNLEDINGNPILNEAGIKRFEDALSEEYRDARLKGVFYTMRGLIYKEFGVEHEVICEHDKVIAADCPYHYRNPDPVICVVDPHDRLPHHVIWAYVDRSDDVTVDFEMVVHCELPDLAAKIKFIEQKLGYRMQKRLIDPNFGRKPAKSGGNISVMQELALHGVSFFEPCDDVALGHLKVREALHFNHEKPISATNKPKLFFAKDRVPVTIRSMRNLQFEEWQGKTRGDKNAKEVEKEKDNHGADCIRYLIISNPKYGYMQQMVEDYELAGDPR